MSFCDFYRAALLTMLLVWFGIFVFGWFKCHRLLACGQRRRNRWH